MKVTVFAAAAAVVATATAVSALPAPPQFVDWDNTWVACAVNKFRAANGKPLLKFDDKLADISQAHAVEMAQNNKLSSDGFSDKTRTLDVRMKQYSRPYIRYAENIGHNYNWTQFTDVTQNIGSLRDNLLGDYNVIGVASANGGNGIYAAETFAYVTDKDAVDKLPALDCKN
ncbi:hypothetical protein GQ42DRAFT_62528 [Ramicandelaber brevisporus]|nr:hypothetical protein GQ42DRAFT_62528 [Ramicandelaber brevisporus]